MAEAVTLELPCLAFGLAGCLPAPSRRCSAPAVQHGAPANVSCLSTGLNAWRARQMHRLPVFWQ